MFSVIRILMNLLLIITKTVILNFSQKGGSAELPYTRCSIQNPDGTYKYDITAPKTYTDKGKTLQFMYWAIYSDPGCNNLVIKAYNIDGGFSYVSYDNY